MSQPILELKNIHKRFGRSHALRGVDFQFRPGEAHALLGENGSGKSTLMKIAYGEYSPTDGTLLLRGQPVRFANPLQASRAGICMLAQEVPVVGTLTVAENVALGSLPTKRGVVDWGAMYRRAAEALAELGSGLDPRRPVNTLAPGDRQVISIARTVAAQASVVIFDEPTSSLTAERTDALFAIIQRLKERGTAIAFISQRLQDIQPVADLVTVLRDGKAVKTLPIAEADEASLTRLMIGRDLDDYFHREVSTTGMGPEGTTPILSVRDLRNDSTLRGVTFDVRPGEIVGLAGLVGSGHVDVVRSIFGAQEAQGLVEANGRRYERRSPRRSIKQGIAFVTGDRKAEGLLPAQSVAANLTMVSNNRLHLRPLHSALQQLHVGEAIFELNVRPADPALMAGSLSGGNQQKVVLGRWLAHRPRIFLLDEPTRGVDVGAKSEIYRVLRELASEGCAVLVSSSENAELIGLCDRIIAMSRGAIVAELPTDDLDELTVAESIAGVQHHA
ncbi:sugar ABC transporter ATP-binding protein [Streptomyces sp. ISID311]|uniref:sugar ABC transporter ATP-binding protein n=1 Tax=Streptomyces sp. ISID311 TaxID=2601673 RepID=UPI0011BD3C61|nr:sugar ABC transporter ATP-binding protein [Streptomyces sp. ISID311]TXC99895.1 sugar ABC transporter ATP-binding protein [Streptomyces sp. ISID311]